MENRALGLILKVGGLIAVGLGWLVLSGWLGWFGRLPGDIRIVSDGTRIYIPVTSMLVVSIVLTIVVNVVRRLL